MKTEAETDDSGASNQDIEAMLARLKPVEPSPRLMGYLLESVNSVSSLTDDVGELDRPEWDIAEAVSPVTVSEDKLGKWARMMDEAARQATEERLKDLKAAPAADFKIMRWLMAIENTTPEVAAKKSRRSSSLPPHRRFGLWAMSAAATLMLVVGVLAFYPDSNARNTRMVSSNRVVHGYEPMDEELHYSADTGLAEKRYQVNYTDVLELSNENGTVMEVSVPASQKVAVPVEIY